MVRDINFKFVLPSIYINFDIQTKFEVNHTQIGRAFLDFGLKMFLQALVKNRPCLVCAKSIFTLILNVSEKFIEKCRKSRLFGE